MTDFTPEPNDTSLDNQPDGDRQLTTDSAALDEGNTNDSDLGAEVAGDLGQSTSREGYKGQISP